MAKNRSDYLIKNTIIFTMGNLGSKLISFFLVPLYTYALTATEYGVVDLIVTVGTVAVPVLTLNISEAVMRFALDKDADKKKITQIGTGILIIGMLLGLLIFPICHSFNKISQYSEFVYFYVVALSMSQLYLCDLRGKELLVYYSIGNVLNTFFIAALNILFLVVLKEGIEGYLKAYIIANTLTAIYAIVVGKGYKSFNFSEIDKGLLARMAKYSIVLIPNSFMWWIMNSSDRIMVSSMISVAANGIYAVSYKLPTLVSTLTTIFNQAWSYSAIREEGTADESEYNNKIFKVLIGIVMLTGIGILTFAKPFLSVYVSKEYYIAWKYMPFLTVGCVYLTMASFMATSYTVHKDSFGYLFSGMFGAIFNIVMNFILIPLIGVYGAAIATCISYILVFVFRLFHTRKYIKYNIKNKEFLLGSIILFLSAALMYVDNWSGFGLQCFLLLVVICLFSDIWLPIVRKMFQLKRRQ
ncbi:oligosaccharide flippase family protein [Ruminococcus sp. AF20-12LB]|uniref:lipopolysaccharide biosynthesis protein n=1 Tax=Ruminococcus sp. AF20-12LB TaxID=2293160 RepID=UPI000E4A26E9|nr:oligosaccharide flippase family protein [Ruminococcus sp. AF20-12LB]RHR08644.1 flippase [Ruminococcus sp. AF20-12LB]